MSNLRTAAQQALERLRKYHYGNGFAEDAECIADLEAALAQQAEPQEAELSAALGLPGGISDPVLDRKTLLQMVAALREAAQQALEALTAHADLLGTMYLKMDAITALRAALAESGRDWSLLEATQESLREHMAEIHRLRAAIKAVEETK